MRIWKTYILGCVLLGSALCCADSTPNQALRISEYRAELERLRAAAQQMNGSAAVPDALEHLPQSWRVHTEQGDFEISSEGLRRDVRRYGSERSVANATDVRVRLETLQREIDGFEKSPPDVSAKRSALASILARPEFGDVHGPTWMDRLKRWLFEKLLRFLGGLFRSSAIPTVGKYFVYALIGAAGLALLNSKRLFPGTFPSQPRSGPSGYRKRARPLQEVTGARQYICPTGQGFRFSNAKDSGNLIVRVLHANTCG
jgi:hypothetical protein